MAFNYETHRPRYGYTKIMPESLFCPLCNRNSLLNSYGNQSCKPTYLPSNPNEGGDHVCVYACRSCWDLCKIGECVGFDDAVEFIAEFRARRSEQSSAGI